MTRLKWSVMQKFSLPYVILPSEFLILLKSNFTASSSQNQILDIIHTNPPFEKYLENVFEEFGSGKSLSKSLSTLGWHNFRDRLASVYLHKLIKGTFPTSTQIKNIEQIKEFESRYSDHEIHGNSRAFLLGIYLKFANIENRKNPKHSSGELKIPEEIGAFLRLSQVKSEKIDWLILILIHLLFSLGDKVLLNALMSGKKIEELFPLMNLESKKMMFENLLVYSASINDPEFFLYNKI